MNVWTDSQTDKIHIRLIYVYMGSLRFTPITSYNDQLKSVLLATISTKKV